MGRYFNQWGQCRAPNCTANLRRNSHEIYCNAHNLNDIRWGSPTQRRISQRELHNPLAKVRRLRKDRPDVEWGLMSANWEALVENCKSISNSRDADLRHRRRAAWVMCQVAEGITPDEAVTSSPLATSWSSTTATAITVALRQTQRSRFAPYKPCEGLRRLPECATWAAATTALTSPTNA